MPTVITCLSREAKQAVMNSLKGDALEELITELDSVPLCKGVPIGFGTKRGRESGREPSEYQKFIGECMKKKGIKSFGEAPAAMKACAAEWRRLKK